MRRRLLLSILTAGLVLGAATSVSRAASVPAAAEPLKASVARNAAGDQLYVGFCVEHRAFDPWDRFRPPLQTFTASPPGVPVPPRYSNEDDGANFDDRSAKQPVDWTPWNRRVAYAMYNKIKDVVTEPMYMRFKLYITEQGAMRIDLTDASFADDARRKLEGSKQLLEQQEQAVFKQVFSLVGDPMLKFPAGTQRKYQELRCDVDGYQTIQDCLMRGVSDDYEGYGTLAPVEAGVFHSFLGFGPNYADFVGGPAPLTTMAKGPEGATVPPLRGNPDEWDFHNPQKPPAGAKFRSVNWDPWDARVMDEIYKRLDKAVKVPCGVEFVVRVADNGSVRVNALRGAVSNALYDATIANPDANTGADAPLTGKEPTVQEAMKAIVSVAGEPLLRFPEGSKATCKTLDMYYVKSIVVRPTYRGPWYDIEHVVE